MEGYEYAQAERRGGLDQLKSISDLPSSFKAKDSDPAAVRQLPDQVDMIPTFGTSNQ